MPKISIITVTYNAEDYIAATMKSVAEQGFTDYEHLIIDGASTDRTLEIASKKATDKVSIHSQKDTGIYHGMNRGLKYARGEYFLFLNAGDKFASKDTLAKYAEAIDEGYEIIYGDTVIIDFEGKELRPRHLKAPKVLTVDSFSDGMLICHQAFMVKSGIAEKYSKEYKYSADYDWCIRCIKKTTPQKCINLEHVTIHYLDDGATEKHKVESLKERFKIMVRHYGFFKTLYKHLSFLPRAAKRRLHILHHRPQ